jgi:hypothetical protein
LVVEPPKVSPDLATLYRNCQTQGNVVLSEPPPSLYWESRPQVVKWASASSPAFFVHKICVNHREFSPAAPNWASASMQPLCTPFHQFW